MKTTSNVYQLTNDQGQTATAWGANVRDAVATAADAGVIGGTITRAILMRADPTSPHDAKEYLPVRVVLGSSTDSWRLYADQLRGRYDADSDQFSAGTVHMLDILCEFIDQETEAV